MNKKPSTENSDGIPKLDATIDSIIQDLCQKHHSDNIEEDIIALFEDIIKFFSGREEDFIDFDSIPMDQKEQIYNEIMIIINLLKKLGKSVDRNETIKLLSQNLIVSFSKKSKNYLITRESLSTEEESRLKKEFSIITIQALYQEQQKKLTKQLPSPQNKNLTQLETKIKDIIKGGPQFSSNIKKSTLTAKKHSPTRTIQK